jgi:hypothetical protein
MLDVLSTAAPDSRPVLRYDWRTRAFINFLPALPRASEFYLDADPHFTSPLVYVMCYDGILDGNAQ